MMAEKKNYRYEFISAGEDTGIRFLDTKLKLPYRLDEKTRELVGVAEENWKKRIKITRATDIDTRIPFFVKTERKLKSYDVYENIKGDRFIHDKEKSLFIGIDESNKNIILHVKPTPKFPTIGTLPFIHKPIYLGKIGFKDYPYAYATTTLVSIQAILPLVEELSTVNPALTAILATTPALAGYVAEKIVRNKKLQAEVRKDIYKFEDLVHDEYSKLKKWEKAHLEKRLEKVI
jgi:hypothetical protein